MVDLVQSDQMFALAAAKHGLQQATTKASLNVVTGAFDEIRSSDPVRGEKEKPEQCRTKQSLDAALCS